MGCIYVGYSESSASLISMKTTADPKVASRDVEAWRSLQARYRAYCLHPTLYSAVPTALTPALGGSALATLPRHPRAPARRSALPVHPTPTPGPHDPSSRRSPPARPRGGRCRPGPRPRAALRTHNAVRFPDLSSSLPPTPPPPPLRPPPTHPPTPGPSVTIMKSEAASSSLPSPEEALCHPSAGTNPRWMEYFTTAQFGEDFFFSPFSPPPLLSPSPPPLFFLRLSPWVFPALS